jgi:hypothetical protein
LAGFSLVPKIANLSLFAGPKPVGAARSKSGDKRTLEMSKIISGVPVLSYLLASCSQRLSSFINIIA